MSRLLGNQVDGRICRSLQLRMGTQDLYYTLIMFQVGLESANQEMGRLLGNQVDMGRLLVKQMDGRICRSLQLRMGTQDLYHTLIMFQVGLESANQEEFESVRSYTDCSCILVLSNKSDIPQADQKQLSHRDPLYCHLCCPCHSYPLNFLDLGAGNPTFLILISTKF